MPKSRFRFSEMKHLLRALKFFQPDTPRVVLLLALMVVSIGLNAPDGPALDEGKIAGLATGVLELLGKDGR